MPIRIGTSQWLFEESRKTASSGGRVPAAGCRSRVDGQRAPGMSLHRKCWNVRTCRSSIGCWSRRPSRTGPGRSRSRRRRCRRRRDRRRCCRGRSPTGCRCSTARRRSRDSRRRGAPFWERRGSCRGRAPPPCPSGVVVELVDQQHVGRGALDDLGDVARLARDGRRRAGEVGVSAPAAARFSEALKVAKRTSARGRRRGRRGGREDEPGCRRAGRAGNDGGARASLRVERWTGRGDADRVIAARG